MLKRTFWLALMALFLAAPARAYERYWNYCQQGGQKVNVSGLLSSQPFQQTYPSCTVTVYVAGTLTLATLYSDNLTPPTALGNPFTANSATGFFEFYAAKGRYDVQLTPITGGSPWTWGDILLCDAIGPDADTGCGSGGGGAGGLGNGTTVIDASTLPGTDFGSKVNSAVASICATYGGGTVDARGLPGNQTSSSNIILGSNSCQITLIIPVGNLTMASGKSIKYFSYTQIHGQGMSSTSGLGSWISATDGSAPLIDSGLAYTASTSNVEIDHMTLNAFPPGLVVSATNIALNLPGLYFSHIHDLQAAGSYGLILSTPSGGNGCVCGNLLEHIYAAGLVRGVDFEPNANSNVYIATPRVDTEYQGTAIYVSGGAFSNDIFHQDLESDAVGLLNVGQNTTIRGGYWEGIGAVTPTWCSSGGPCNYLAGQVIHDSNGAIQVAMTSGTTNGATHPTWETNPGQITTDGTVTWLLTDKPTIILASGSHNTQIYGGNLFDPSTYIDNFSSDPNFQFLSSKASQMNQLTTGYNSSSGYISVGGIRTGNMVLSAAPVLGKTLVAGSATSTYEYCVVCKLPGGGASLPSSFATIINAPDVLGEVEATPTINAGGFGCHAGDVFTLQGGNNDATVTADVVDGTGAVTHISAYTPGSGGLLPAEYYTTGGTCLSGHNPYFSVLTNYVSVTPPAAGAFDLNTNSYPSTQFCVWDIVGRNTGGGTSTAFSVGTGIYWDYGHNSGTPGTFYDAGYTPAAYVAPTRDSSADLFLGSGSSTSSYINQNDVRLFSNASTNTPSGYAYQISHINAAGNKVMDFLVAPVGAGASSSINLAFNSDLAANHIFSCNLLSTGLTCGLVSGGTGFTTTFTGPLAAPQFVSIDLHNSHIDFTAGSSGAPAVVASDIQLQSPSSVQAAGYNFVLPGAEPTANQLLSCGSITTHVCTGAWATPSSGSFLIASGTISSGSVNWGSDLYLSPYGTGAIATQANADAPMANAGTVSNFYMHLLATIAGGSTVVFTIQKNDSNTTVTCTVLASAQDCNDTAHSFAYSVGDKLNIGFTHTGTPGSTSAVWSIKVVGQ